jgi:hypothetical protein
MWEGNNDAKFGGKRRTDAAHTAHQQAPQPDDAELIEAIRIISRHLPRSME